MVFKVARQFAPAHPRPNISTRIRTIIASAAIAMPICLALGEPKENITGYNSKAARSFPRAANVGVKVNLATVRKILS